MKILKALLQIALISSALLPWNATAINRADFVSLLGSHGSKASASILGTNQPEELLVKGLMEVTQGQLQDALDTINQLLVAAPNFKLAYLVRGDLLMARAQQFQSFGNPAADSTQIIADFREEARKRIERHLEQQSPGNLPEPLWQMDNKQPYAIVVDADKSRLYLYRNEGGEPKYVADYYATIGKNGSEKKSEGDKRTPIGVYFAGSKLNRKLDDLYGDAAYPLSYPNEWDKRQGKSGGGIWLHGTPSNTYSRAPRASDGCVVISNPDLKALAPILQNGNVPFIIANNLQWLEAQKETGKKQALQKAIEQWRKDWQSQNTDIYLSHYSQQFASDAVNSKSMDFSQWATEKRRIQASKPKVDISLSNISMFRYPISTLPMAVVTFEQSFKSPYLDSQMRKRQYWIFENQQWKIIYEGSA
ncbi:MAG TPA: L,D-transpeptidase family protein [Methylophilaceae bacterium]|nr:L,D-transpeptidase family protein [Methylophilaceae bacterium]